MPSKLKLIFCAPGPEFPDVQKGVYRLQRLIEKGGGLPQAHGVKPGKLITLVLAAMFWAGCQKSGDVAPTPSVDDLLPTQAQPKLPTMRIYLGAEQLDAELALTTEQERIGMMFRTNIQETDAMLFVFSQPYRASFWMKNCPESLSAAYIDPDGVIEEIHHFEKNDTNAVVAARDDILYVLEVKDGWFARHNINPGTVICTEKGSLRETFFSNRSSIFRRNEPGKAAHKSQRG
ncbi:MAG: DUF192 domain-containing protein [Verrucomicrobiota bacterium]